MYRVAQRRFVVALRASFVAYLAILILSQSAALHITDTGIREAWPWLAALVSLVSPSSLTSGHWRGSAGLLQIVLFGVSVGTLVGLWLWMLWLVRPGRLTLSLRGVLGAVLLVSVPLLLLIGLFSDDLYLYAFYGRIVSHYGQNPYFYSPDMFWGDPQLEKVFWTWLPASYGPLWLMVSGGLSWLGGEHLLHSVLFYKVAMLAAHLATTCVVWYLLTAQRAPWATWGTVFYGLNPLVLFEAVGNGHNDALVALLVAVGAAAVIRRFPHIAVAALAAAVMVKAPAVLMLAPVAAAVVFARRGWLRRAAATATIGVVAVAVVLALYLPFWAGSLLFLNIRWNPASWEVNNSLWELARHLGGNFNRMLSDSERHVVPAITMAVVAFTIWRIRRGAAVVPALASMWLVYTFTLNWVWPWYFLAAFPLVAMAGPGRLAMLYSGVTIGGLLFWLQWTDPPHPYAPWLYYYRAVLMFGPTVAMAAGMAGVAALRAWRARRAMEWFPRQQPVAEWVAIDGALEES